MGLHREVRAVRPAVAALAGAAVVNPLVLARVFADGHFHVVWVSLLLWGLSGVLLAAGIVLAVSARAGQWAAASWTRLALLAPSTVVAVVIVELALGSYPRHSGPRQLKVTNLEYAFDVSLNADSFRDAEFQREKPPDETRVFLIGDSQIYGNGVPENYTIPQLLQARLRQETKAGYRVFNLGVPGASPDQYARVAQRFAGYSPDLVLVALYVDNDLVDRESAVAWLKQRQVYRILDRSLNTLLEGCPFPWVRRFDAEPPYKEAACRGEINPFLVTRAAVADNQAYYNSLARAFDADSHVKDALLRIRDLFTGARFGLVLLPSKYQVDAAYFPELRKIGFTLPDSGVIDDVIQRRIRTWAAATGIEVLDLLPGARAADARPGVSLYHPVDDHFNVAGNNVISDAVYRWIAHGVSFR